ncbi:CDP-glucose 4,6-dehydratase [Selenomonas sp. TAMA-11512]|nr:CDP-glucose 4,6-dehydratase [Selenomonas sp. TAMA-11512]
MEGLEKLGEFYRGKHVFLTGHTGFKGTWLSLLLESLGAKVYGYALAPDTSFFERVRPRLSGSCIAPLADRRTLSSALSEANPEIVMHLAAHSTVDRTGTLTETIFAANVMGTVQLLEAVRGQSSVRAVLVVTSDKCYTEKANGEALQEDDPLGAEEAYSTSKACQELVADSYRKTFFCKEKENLPLATARASNVLGGGDYHYDRLLPSLLLDFLEGRPFSIRNGDAVRPWQYVLDALEGYLLLAKALYSSEDGSSDYCGGFNFGPDEDGIVTVRTLVEETAKHFTGAQVLEPKQVKQRVQERGVLRLSNEKAKCMLGWKPRHRFSETIKEAAEMAKEEYAGKRMDQLARVYIERSGIR